MINFPRELIKLKWWKGKLEEDNVEEEDDEGAQNPHIYGLLI